MAVIVLMALLAGCVENEPAGDGPDAPLSAFDVDDDRSTRQDEPDAETALPSRTTPTLAPESRVNVSADRGISLGVGTGWGRIELTSSEDIELQVSVTHETMKDLDTFSDDGDGVYDERNHTFLYVFPEGDGPLAYGSYWFQWWGSPYSAFWPGGSWVFEGWPERIPLEAGRTVVVVAATTVPGYTVSIAPPGAESRHAEWTLRDHPGHWVVAPEAVETTLVDEPPLGVQERSVWEVVQEDLPPSMVAAKVWYRGEGMGARAGIGDRDFGFQECGASELLPVRDYGPQVDYNLGGSTGQSTLMSATSEPRCLRFFADTERTGVDTDYQEEGAGFAAVPY